MTCAHDNHTIHRFGRAGNVPAGWDWRVLMTVFGPFCMAPALITADEISSRQSTKRPESDLMEVVRGRVIDLSPAAGRALGVDGLALVSLSR
jgi:hypothetical protein